MGMAAAAAPARADELRAILQKGELVAGVKADYKPFGYRDPSGAIVGFEVDLAQQIADVLGVKLDLVPVQDANRIPFLSQGKVGLIIATMNVTPERRKQADFIVPSYFGSGANVLALKTSGLKDWGQLAGKKVCAIQGSLWNRMIGDKYHPQLVEFRGNTEAETALRQGDCEAFLAGNTTFVDLLADQQNWGMYDMPLKTLNEIPWSMAVPLGEGGKGFGELLSGIAYGWHRTGAIIDLEKKWHIPPSPWVEAMHKEMTADIAP